MNRTRTYQLIRGWPKAIRHLLLDVEGLPLFGSDGQRFVKGPLKRQHVFLSSDTRMFSRPPFSSSEVYRVNGFFVIPYFRCDPSALSFWYRTVSSPPQLWTSTAVWTTST